MWHREGCRFPTKKQTEDVGAVLPGCTYLAPPPKAVQESSIKARLRALYSFLEAKSAQVRYMSMCFLGASLALTQKRAKKPCFCHVGSQCHHPLDQLLYIASHLQGLCLSPASSCLFTFLAQFATRTGAFVHELNSQPLAHSDSLRPTISLVSVA